MSVEFTKLMNNKSEKIAEAVIEEMDQSTLLGAAFDCLSKNAQDKFKQKIINIVETTQ